VGFGLLNWRAFHGDGECSGSSGLIGGRRTVEMKGDDADDGDEGRRCGGPGWR